MSRRELSAVTAAAAAIAAVLAAGAGARAEVVDATSTTVLTGRADPRDGVVRTSVPVVEMVTLRAADLRVPGFDDVVVVMAGWGELQLADRGEGGRGLGDLDVAFAEGSLLRRRITLRLGRQLLVAGAGRNLAFDGLAVTARPWRWVGVSAHAGVPVTPRFAVDRGDAMVGGRAFVKPSYDAEAGLSFLQVLDAGEIARRDLALDARFVPARSLPLALSGFALWSLPEQRLGEGNVTATYQLGARVEVSGDFRRTAPDLFLPRNSIFSVFAQERRDEAGGFLYFRLLSRLRLQGSYHVIVDDGGAGQDASAKLTATVGAARRDTVGVESRRLDLSGSSSGYTSGRAFSTLQLSPLLLATLDASAFLFDTDINGQRRSYVGAGALAYDFSPGWRAVATGIGSVTPFAERRLEGMAKLVYQFTVRARQVSP
jgi:hypothetical protein